MTTPRPITTKTTAASHHDVVVVGSRCAGAATAMLLARAGHDVVLVDRADLPSDANSTHSLVRGGVVQLSRWGLLDEVLASGAPPIRSVLFQQYRDGWGAATDPPVRLPVKEAAGVDMMLAPRRYVLDRILVDAAVRAGAALLTRTTASAVLRDDSGTVTGVVTRRPGGPSRQLSARMVVAADGVHSRMATLLGAETLESHARGGGCFYTYVAGVPWDGFEFHLAPDAFAGVFPTHHGEACVWLMRPAPALASVLSAGARRTDAWLNALSETVPDLARRVQGGTITAPVRGAVGLPNHVRQAAGPGWALVGDAGYHRDPITGHGITDAFRDADLLAEAVDRLLREPGRGHGAERTAMAAYQTARDAALAETFRLTRALGDFPAPERFVQLQIELSRALDAEAGQLARRPGRTRELITSA